MNGLESQLGGFERSLPGRPLSVIQREVGELPNDVVLRQNLQLLDVPLLEDAEGEGEAALGAFSFLGRQGCLVSALPVGRVEVDELPAPLLRAVESKYLAAFRRCVEPEEGVV